MTPLTRATVTHTVFDKGYVVATDADGRSYFILYNACETMGQYRFQDLDFGSVVEFTAIDHPKGLRGIGVRILSR